MKNIRCLPGTVTQHRPYKSPKLDARLEEIRDILMNSLPKEAAEEDPLADAQVIADSYNFQQRFGISFNWPRKDRKALINLMYENGLSDAEVKILRITGNLARTPFGVKLVANAWLAWFGTVQLTFWIGIIGILAVNYLISWQAPSFQPLKGAAFVCMLSALIYLTYWLHVKPWLLQRRTRRKRL